MKKDIILLIFFSLNKYGVKCENKSKSLGKKDRLMKLILMVGSNGILDTGKEEEVKMMKDRLADGKKLLVDLLVF